MKSHTEGLWAHGSLSSREAQPQRMKEEVVIKTSAEHAGEEVDGRAFVVVRLAPLPSPTGLGRARSYLLHPRSEEWGTATRDKQSRQAAAVGNFPVNTGGPLHSQQHVFICGIRRVRNGVPLYGESFLLPTRYTRVHASAQPANTWQAGQRGVHIPVYADSEASSTQSGAHTRTISRAHA